jgi:hypothetical protein
VARGKKQFGNIGQGVILYGTQVGYTMTRTRYDSVRYTIRSRAYRMIWCGIQCTFRRRALVS